MTLARPPRRPGYVALAFRGENNQREVWNKYLF
jgi:hypothetical protein